MEVDELEQTRQHYYERWEAEGNPDDLKEYFFNCVVRPDFGELMIIANSRGFFSSFPILRQQMEWEQEEMKQDCGTNSYVNWQHTGDVNSLKSYVECFKETISLADYEDLLRKAREDENTRAVQFLQKIVRQKRREERDRIRAIIARSIH